jgi:hypothetical protein
MTEWITSEINNLIGKYGTVPPPWVIFDEHPYSMCWRMGLVNLTLKFGLIGGQSKTLAKIRGLNISVFTNHLIAGFYF